VPGECPISCVSDGCGSNIWYGRIQPASIGNALLDGPPRWGNLRSCSRIAFRPQPAEAGKRMPTASLTQTFGHTRAERPATRRRLCYARRRRTP
jgi:hypothetical protein